MSWLSRFLGNQEGNMAVLFAGGLAVSAVVSAFAVDAASLYHERRMLQHNVDLAAIAAAANPANGLPIAYDALREAGTIGPDASLAELTDPAGDPRLVVEPGHYRPDGTLDPADRFQPGATPTNAVRVSFRHLGTLYFARTWSPVPVIGASAISTTTPQVAFSVGSRLASLNGGIANSLLNTLLGTNVSLSLVDYNGLASAKVDAFAFLDALAFQLGITAGTYDDVLAASADHGQIAKALAAVLNGSQRAAAQKIGNAAGGNGEVAIHKLIDLGDMGQLSIGSGGQNLFADLSALELLSASAGLSDGAHQVALKLKAGLPGLLGIDVDLAVGEPPQGGSWFAIGPAQTVVRTAQVRLRIVVDLSLKLLLLPIIQVRLPLYLEIAPSEAIVGSATCPTGTNSSGSATILVNPGVTRLVLGEISPSSFGNFNTTPAIGLAKLIEIIIKVTGKAHVEIAQTTPIALNFSPSDIAAGTVKTAKTTSFTGSLVASLLGDLELNVEGLSLDLVTKALEALLMPLTPTLDLTISTLLETLGLSLGEADVRVYGVRCTHAVLVG